MKKSKLKDMTMEEKAGAILEEAKKTGLQESFLFQTTFDRYLTQIKVLNGLKETLDNEDMLITKEYVKGRRNLYENPAIKSYNSTASAANKTVETLMKILSQFRDYEEKEEPEDPLMQILRDDSGE